MANAAGRQVGGQEGDGGTIEDGLQTSASATLRVTRLAAEAAMATGARSRRRARIRGRPVLRQ